MLREKAALFEGQQLALTFYSFKGVSAKTFHFHIFVLFWGQSAFIHKVAFDLCSGITPGGAEDTINNVGVELVSGAYKAKLSSLKVSSWPGTLCFS